MKKIDIIMMGIDSEGGDKYTNDSDDAGGETKYGISKRANPGVDIKGLTLEKAINIYEKRYWLSEYDNISDKHLVYMIYDFSLPQGVYKSILVLQKSINKYYKHYMLKEDGKLGPITVGVVEKIRNKVSLRSAFVLEAIDEIKSDSLKRNNSKYILGWANRLLYSWAK